MPKLLFYRDKCIGCSICQEMQPQLWRMSKKDGKAVLLQSVAKKAVHQLEIGEWLLPQCAELITACPVNIIKVG